jgi:hypothetical protein
LHAACGKLVGIEGLACEVDAAGEAGVHFADFRRPLLARGDGDDLDSWMPQQDLDQLEGRVAGPAEDGNLGHGKPPGCLWLR